MINISRVSDWLAQNVNDQLFPRLFLMSPNGTLLAYSKPVDIRELRDQAALISIVWKEHCQGRQPPPVPERRKESARTENAGAASAEQALKPALETLTIESRDCNILIRLVQPHLLLVLVGRRPPNSDPSFKIHPEASGDARYPDLSPSRPPTGSEAPPQGTGGGDKASTMSQRDKDIRLGALHVQRKRLDALANYVTSDFEASSFIMPADSDLQ